MAKWYAELGAVIEAVDISSSAVAVDDLRNHLRDRWDDRRFISATRAEDLIAGVLADHLGTDVVRVTANAEAADGGVDLYVCTADGGVSAAVQVKRRQTDRTEGVQQVRDFVGALVVQGIDHGIFVTTARAFSSAATEAARSDALISHNLSVDLIDGERLLELLRATTPPREPLSLPKDMAHVMTWVGPAGDQLSTLEAFS